MISLAILIRLFIAHLAGDFILQPGSWVKDRAQKHFRSVKLYLHVLIHGILAIIAVGNLDQWLIPVIIILTHFIIDVIKSYQKKNETRWFIIDQCLHVLIILILWKYFIATEYTFSIPEVLQEPKLLLYAAAFLLLTTPTSYFIGVAIERWRKKIEGDKKETLKDGGLWIGILERVLVLIFILLNQLEPVGFLLAAKSVFRFGELQKPGEKNQTEYVLIGTLLSFGIALIVGLITRLLISAISQL